MSQNKDSLVIGFVCDARHAEPSYLLEMLHSLIIQPYTNWHLNIAWDFDGLARIGAILSDYELRESQIPGRSARVQVRRESAERSQEDVLLDLARTSPADFVMAIGKHDYLAHDAMYRAVTLLQERPYTSHVCAQKGRFDESGEFHPAPQENDSVVLARTSLFADGKNGWLTDVSVELADIPAILVFHRP